MNGKILFAIFDWSIVFYIFIVLLILTILTNLYNDVSDKEDINKQYDDIIFDKYDKYM